MSEGLHFTSCADFIDVLEFRLAWCFFNTPARSWRQLTGCVGKTFGKSSVNERIADASISCWSGWNEGETPKVSMWEVYGKGKGAIRVLVNSDRLIEHVETAKNPIAGVG